MWDERTEEHLKSHLSFPAKGSDLISACNNMSDISAEDKAQFETLIDPEKNYNSLEELKSDLMVAPKEMP